MKIAGILAASLLFFSRIASASPAVTFTATPARPVMVAGKPTRVQLKVQVNGAAKLLVLRANLGKISPPKAEGQGVWTATYTPPSLQFPTVALLYVEVQQGSKRLRRWLALPIAIRLGLPLIGQRGTQIAINVDGQDFGPVTVGRQAPELQVVVPPGAASYTQTRTLPGGVTQSKTKRFELPPFPRIAVVAPKEATAGQVITFYLFQVDARGRRYTQDNPLEVNCPGAELRFIKGRRSEQLFRFRLSGQTGPLQCRIFMKRKPRIFAVHAMTVKISRRLRFKVVAFPRRLKINSANSAKVTVRVSDQFGNVAEAPDLRVTANGKPINMVRLGPGRWRGWIYAPQTKPPGNRVVVQAAASQATPGRAVVTVLGGITRRLAMRVRPRQLMADGKNSVLVEITAVDRYGMPPSDREIKVDSEQGKILFLHWVKPGLFRGRFRPTAQPGGGVAAITAQTEQAPAVEQRIKLIPIPQRFLFTPVIGTFSDFERTLGVSTAFRFEYAAYKKLPAVFVGGKVLLAPHFSIEDGTGDLIDHRGVAAGAAAHTRLRFLRTRRFGLGVSVDVGVLGLYSSYRQRYPTTVQRNSDSRAVFTLGAGLEASVVTRGQQECFLLLQMRYLTGRFEDAAGRNRVTLLGALGYRFVL